MKVVLVTGSSSGFGRLTAETLARRGYLVFGPMGLGHLLALAAAKGEAA